MESCYIRQKEPLNLLKLSLFIFLLLLHLPAAKAQKVVLSGHVTDSKTGKAISGAHLTITNERNSGTYSSENGRFSFELLPGNYTIECGHIGYQTFSKTIELNRETELDIQLVPGISLGEVAIVEDKIPSVESEVQTSVIHLQIDKINKLPVLLGEPDLIKTLQLLPGVQSGVDGATGLYVRGGGADQNLFLLDGMPLYNIQHMSGIFSVFNPGAIESVDLYKGGFPAQFGGRLSSVVDVKSKVPPADKWHGQGSVGILLSRLSIGGPINKGKTSVLFSLRRSYYDVLARPFIKAYSASQGEYKVNTGYYFYDANLRIDHKLNDKQRISVQGFLGRDNFYLNTKDNYMGYITKNHVRIGYGTLFGQVSLQSKLRSGTTNHTTIGLSRYRLKANASSREYMADSSAGSAYDFYVKGVFISYINDFSARTDFVNDLKTNRVRRYGASFLYHVFKPGGNAVDQVSVAGDPFQNHEIKQYSPYYAPELTAYYAEKLKLGYRWQLDLGLHANWFTQHNYHKFSLQPRANALFRLSPQSSLKASYAMMQQNLHLLTNPGIGFPTDLWVPATQLAPSETSHQITFGYAAKILNNLQLSIEGYYKKMNNLIEYNEGSFFLGAGNNWEKSIVVGKGESHGIEFFLEKRMGKLSGWLGYTLSWTNRQFAQLNNGKPFPYRYDRRHDVNLTLNYQKSDRFDIGIVWVYGTGYAFSLPTATYNAFDFTGNGINGYNVYYYSSRNNYRTPAYHRLDIGFNFHKTKKWGLRTWRLGVYNVYNHKNPFTIIPEFDYNNNSGLPNRYYKLSILPIIPSLAYAFEF